MQTGNKGYDDIKLHERLWNKHGIRAIINIRNMWKDSDETHLILDYEEVIYNYKGNVSCACI